MNRAGKIEEPELRLNGILKDLNLDSTQRAIIWEAVDDIRLKEAGRAMGRAKSPAKTEAARANAKLPRKRGPISEEHKAKLHAGRDAAIVRKQAEQEE